MKYLLILLLLFGSLNAEPTPLPSLKLYKIEFIRGDEHKTVFCARYEITREVVQCFNAKGQLLFTWIPIQNDKVIVKEASDNNPNHST